jgi:hypothetical protein
MAGMEAGRELDALVAEKVMGCKVTRFTNSLKTVSARCDCPDDPHEYHTDFGGFKEYSTEMGPAWEVVEKMRPIADLTLETYGTEPFFCIAIFRKDAGKGSFQAEAKTAPHAICLAALKAVGAC